MDFIKYENFLGEHITFAETITGNDFNKVNFNSEDTEFRYCSNSEYLRELIDYKAKDYYGMPYIDLFIKTDKIDKIQSVTIHFRKTIDRKFYDLFTNDYGEPNSILVIDKRNIISESTLRDDNNKVIQTSRKSELELKEGTFEDKPLYIIWEKDNYEIKALLRHKTGISEITFSSSEEK